MKKYSFLLFILFLFFANCKKDQASKKISVPPVVISPEYDGTLLFVNKPNFQIATNVEATFSSSDPNIQISSTGLIKRFISGEVAPIIITSKTDPGSKITIYALASTDSVFDMPFARFHGNEDAPDPDFAYHQGWQTLQKLPVTNETYVIVLRHGDADKGVDYSVNHDDAGPANWWLSCDSTLARQLNNQGIQRSTVLGQIFKDLNYPINRVTSSEFCRALTTAKLINAGPTIAIDANFNHSAHNTSGKSLFTNLIASLKLQTTDNKISLLVTHHPINIPGKNAYPTFPEISPFNWTGAYFVKISPDKTITYEGAASWGMFKFWRDYKLKRI